MPRVAQSYIDRCGNENMALSMLFASSPARYTSAYFISFLGKSTTIATD